MAQQVILELPTPHAKQREILLSPAKRKVVCTGRRFGKTLYGALEAIDDERGGGMLAGQKVLIGSTSQDQSDIFWQYLKRWFAPLTHAGYAYKNETKRILELPNGGAVRVKTGSDADVLRGFDADKLILDECSFLDPDAWYQVGAPMMADRDGTAIFLSTPLRKNWFYILFNRAIADTTGRWQAWHATTLDNPHLSKVAVAELAADMTEDGYKQEILAEFLEGSGQVFRNIEACATAVKKEPYAGEFVMSVDTAQQSDFTWITVMDAVTREQVDSQRFNQVEWAIYQQRIKLMHDKWKPRTIIYEINGSKAMFEALQRENLPVFAFETTGSSKPPLIESLVLAFERGQIKIFNDPILLGELGAFERQVSPSTGHSRYSAPNGLHDDGVMSLALAWHGIVSRPALQIMDFNW